jgi:diguanylate cyclase (GGDEF)-like protein
VTRTAAAAVGAATCTLALYDPTTDELIAGRPRYEATSQAIPQFRFKLSKAPASEQVVRTGAPHLSNTPASDPLYDTSVTQHGVSSILTAPVRFEGRLLGLLYALNKPGGFSPEDVGTLQNLADAVGVTLANIQLYSEERSQRLLNESLREVSRALVGMQSEDTSLGIVLDQMWRVLRYEAAAALVLEHGELRTAAARGMVPVATLPASQRAELSSVLEMRRSARVEDAGRRLPELGLPESAGTALVAPLLAKGHLLGVLVASFPRPYDPTPREAELLAIFSEHAALFVEAGAVLRRERLARLRAVTTARVTRLAVRRQDARSLLRDACPELMSAAGADRSVAYLRHEANPVLIPVADWGLRSDESMDVREMRLDVGSGPLSGLAEGHALVFQADTALPAARVVPIPDARTVLVLPLCTRQETLGALLLAWVDRDQRLEPALVEYLNDVAQQVALGVENARLVSRLAEMATTDELTRLPNRRRFSEALRVEIARARRSGGFALVMVDLDHLKQINDTHGHQAGDQVIRHVADVLRRGTRLTDCAARLGGEEFGVVLTGTDWAGAILKAERFREEVASHPLEGIGTVGISAGIALCPGDGMDETSLVRAADRRLYLAKDGGRNRVCWKDEEIR